MTRVPVARRTGIRRQTTLMVTPVRAALLVTGTGCGDTADHLPKYGSLSDVRKAVDDVVHCDENPRRPPEKVMDPPGFTGQAVMCVDAVEILWFDSSDALDRTYDMFYSAAGEAGSVYFVRGKNWFVVDYSEVQVGAVVDRRVDMKRLADELGAEYIVAER